MLRQVPGTRLKFAVTVSTSYTGGMRNDDEKLKKKVAKLDLNQRRRHIFLCNDTGKCNCASESQMMASWKYLKKRLKALRKDQRVAVRCSRSYCLDICTSGPVAVVYPEGTWYAGCTETVLDKIIDRHLLKGEVVCEHAFADPDNAGALAACGEH